MLVNSQALSMYLEKRNLCAVWSGGKNQHEKFKDLKKLVGCEAREEHRTFSVRAMKTLLRSWTYCPMMGNHS